MQTAESMIVLLPRGNHAVSRLYLDILARTVGQQVEPRVFYTEWQGKVLYVFGTAGERSAEWRGVFLRHLGGGVLLCAVSLIGVGVATRRLSQSTLGTTVAGIAALGLGLAVAGLGTLFLCTMIPLLNLFSADRPRTMQVEIVAVERNFPTAHVHHVFAVNGIVFQTSARMMSVRAQKGSANHEMSAA